MEYIQALKNLLGAGNVLDSRSDCVGYSRDMSVHQAVPDVVVFVDDADQVREVVKIAAASSVPIVARGAGSSVTGAVLASKGGIILNMRRMNAIKQINLEDGYVVVEPGVVCDELNKALAPTHFFPPDPGSAPVATIGGMASTNASGVRAVKYGTTRDYVMGMKVVLADGSLIHTGTKSPKSSAGYDLTRLFCTAEGTLGIITELTLKILPKPAFSAFGQLHFPDITAAGACVRELFAEGVPISTCEILDGICIDAVKRAMGLDIPDNVTCILFMEIDGDEPTVQAAVERISETMKRHGGLTNDWSSDKEKRAAIWSARHGLVAALNRLNPGRRQVPLLEDFGVPMSRIPETIADIQEVGKRYGLDIATFGHIGDGNLHPVLLLDPYNQEDWDKARKIADEFARIALKYEGTFTAEHGLGMAKAPLIERELGPGLKVMQAIKDALDPKNILNPGKLGLEGSPTDIYEQSPISSTLRENRAACSFGSELDNEILACSQCGFCTMSCPTFASTGREALNARGRNSLSFGLLAGTEKPSEQLAERLYQCTLCDNCAATCPAGVKTSKVVLAARKRLYEAGLSPEIFNAAFKSMRDYGNPFMALPERRTDIFDAIPAPAADTEVIYWPGCVSAYQELKIVPSVVKALEAAGVKWTTLGAGESCCGYLAYATGAMDVLAELIEKNTKALLALGDKTIVTSCPGCAKAFRDVYPSHGGPALPMLHSVEFFDRLIKEGRLTFKADAKPMKLVYHDPCDLGRHLGIYDEPRNILKAIPGLTLVEFPDCRERAKCCGAGGGLKGLDLALSNELADRRVLSAAELGVEAIASACASCKQNLTQASARLKKDDRIAKRIPVVDIMELIARNVQA